MRLQWVCRAVTSGLLLIFAADASAEIFKCKDANGQIVYTQNACPPGAEPQELPVGIPRDTGSSFQAGEPPERRLSLKAQALKEKFDACRTPSSAECQEFAQLSYFCKRRTNWGMPECEVMNEFNAAVSNKSGRLYGRSNDWDRERCRETGDQRACESAKCPNSMMLDGTDAEVRACSRFRSLPNTEAWAQISGGVERNARAWQGEYLCLDEKHTQSPLGETTAMRPVIKIQDVRKVETQAPTYKIIGKPELDRYFSSREAAVEAACLAMGDWWKKLPEPPRPSLPAVEPASADPDKTGT